MVVEEHRAGIRPLEAEQQAVDRRFPGAGRADERHVVARPDPEGHPVERVRRLGQVAEGHVRELDAAGEIPGVGAVPHGFRPGFEDRLHPLEEGEGAHQGRPRFGEGDHRGRELAERGVEGQEVREAEVGLSFLPEQGLEDEGEDDQGGERRERAPE